MIGGLTFTIGSLLFMLLLLVVYYTKERSNTLRVKLYRNLLAVILVLTISEIISTVSIYFVDNYFLNSFLLKFHWYTGIILFWLLYNYTFVCIDKIELDHPFKLFSYNTTAKMVSLVSIIISIIYWFIPCDPFDPNFISYRPGLICYIVMAYGCFLYTLMAIGTIKRYKTINKRIVFVLLLLLIQMLFLMVLEWFFPTIALSPLCAAQEMYFLYHNIENPDILFVSELNTTKNEIEKSSKAKTDFLANMSRDIKTPMNVIRGYANSLNNRIEFDEEAIRSDIKVIDQAGNSLIDIIKNILDISKIESGVDVVEIKEYSLKKMVNNLRELISNRLKNKSVEFIIEADENIPSVIKGDENKVNQILLNLLTNSAKYTEVGKIKLVITSKIDNGIVDLNIKVSDTGYGIKKEDYDKVFEKFSRLEDAVNNHIDGSGLGLVITKKYVDLLNGKIWFESEYEAGTSFYVNIKQAVVDSTPIGDINKVDEVKEERLDCSAYTALIVDDNKLNIKVATRVLSNYKFNIDSANGGKEAINKVKAGTKYDIIFMDHMMPELDGIETLHILQKLEDYTLPPVVVLTANAVSGVEEMYLKEGFDYYLSKPIKVQELDKVIVKYFKK